MKVIRSKQVYINELCKNLFDIQAKNSLSPSDLYKYKNIRSQLEKALNVEIRNINYERSGIIEIMKYNKEVEIIKL